MPADRFATVAAFLVHQFPYVGAAEWSRRLLQGEVLLADGAPAAADSPAHSGGWLFYYRTVGQEAAIPFTHEVLYRDADLLVVDKPHFLPVIPSGGYLQETLLLRLKKSLDLPDLVPLHRLDRDTAGVLLFSLRQPTRNAYYGLFRNHLVHKTYEAIAPYRNDLVWPLRRESCIGAGTHFMQQAEVDGPVNAITTITPLQTRGALARYQLEPLTGQRHQLRVHMLALGLPIVHDGMYPVLTPEGSSDFAKPLQLLARRLAFRDPLSGQPRVFESQRQLLPLAQLAGTADAWPAAQV
jgi:tRNA pseudouridine32 synthase/23S rRNA pseudouridine746 synthase